MLIELLNGGYKNWTYLNNYIYLLYFILIFFQMILF